MPRCINDQEYYIFSSLPIADATYIAFYDVNIIQNLGKSARKLVQNGAHGAKETMLE